MKTVQDCIINFTRDLEVTDQKTFYNEEEIPNSDHFKLSSSLNLHDDILSIKYEHNIASAIGNIVSVEVEFHVPEKQPQKLTEANNSVVLTDNINYNVTRMNTKKVLLELFSRTSRTFVVTICYYQQKDLYKTAFTIALPIIDQQENWSTKIEYSRLEADSLLYQPITEPEPQDPNDERAVNQKVLKQYEAHICNSNLVQLHKDEFKLSRKSTAEVKTLFKQLTTFAVSKMYDKFNNLDYLEVFKSMLIIEDLNVQKTFNRKFSIKDKTVTKYHDLDTNSQNVFYNLLKTRLCPEKSNELLNKAYIIEIASLLPNDIENFGSILLTEVHNTNPYTSVNLLKATYTASIDFIFGKYIIINAKNQTIPENAITISNSLYDIDFFPNRMTCRTAQRAIEIIENHQLENYFKNFELPNSTKRFIRDSDLEFDNFNWENKKIANNNEQEQAIRNIVNQTAFPSPYVLFGPPGTGKTTTIIEAIVQIIKLKPNARILLTSNTNSNCDNLGIRLLEYVSCNKILRIYSSRYDEHSEKIPVALKQISNYRLETLCKCKSLFCKEKHPFDNPSYEEFYTARVVIATLCSSGRFVTGGIKSDHFDYIFIDEAATNAEPYTLIPISGLGSRFEQITANIVLCGDHKQLGPIIADHYNIILGFRTPMMKRLLMMKKYNCYTHEEVERNSIYVTKLLKNFRSNERILEFSNQNFYNGALQSVASKKIQNFAVGWSALNNPSLPILFHASLSPCYQVGTSLINDGEIALVNYYVQMLLSNGVNGKRVSQKDIGIISTYRAQRENMVLLFKSCYSDVEIGTIDSFQGCEKKIIILSTVRSNTKTFGFLRSSKRLNVALTRAQSLLIIIGNPITLKLNEIWKKFILHCEYYRTFVNHQLCVPAYINNTLFQDIKEPIRLHGR